MLNLYLYFIKIFFYNFHLKLIEINSKVKLTVFKHFKQTYNRCEILTYLIKYITPNYITTIVLR